jgi:hypothetical protein
MSSCYDNLIKRATICSSRKPNSKYSLFSIKPLGSNTSVDNYTFKEGQIRFCQQGLVSGDYQSHYNRIANSFEERRVIHKVIHEDPKPAAFVIIKSPETDVDTQRFF